MFNEAHLLISDELSTKVATTVVARPTGMVQPNGPSV